MLRLSSYVLTALMILLAALAGASLVHYLMYPGEYRFGSEVAGWRYASSAHFTGTALVELGLAAVGLILGFGSAPLRKRVLAQSAVVAIVAVLWVWLGGK